MSNNGHQDILKYFKFVVFFVGRILGKQKNLFNINKLQEIFYPLGDANKRSSVERAFESKFCAFFLFDRLPFSKAFSAAAEQSGRGVYLPPAAYAASRILLPQISFRRTGAACKRLPPCPRRHRPPASLLPCVSEFYGYASKYTCRTCVCSCPAPNHHSRHIQSKKAINM